MRTPVVVAIALTLAATLAVSSKAPVRGDANARGSEMSPSQLQQLMPGRIDMVPLSEFAPVRVEAACDALLDGDYATAAQGFRQGLSKNPTDLAAYVGLLQADPSRWSATIHDLRRAADGNPADRMTTFKLGAALFYEGRAKYLFFDHEEGVEELARAKPLLHQAWVQTNSPVAGLLYAEAEQIPSPHFLLTEEVLNALLARLGGPSIYRQYREAGAGGWQSQPPSVKDVPKASLRPLRGVVRLFASVSGVRVGQGVIQGNKAVFQYEPVPPEQQQKEDYFAAWRDEISAALAGKQRGR